MKWKTPPTIKIYEALGCIADERITKENNEIHVYSSSKNKFYTIQYSEKENAIMSNDNGSYWIGYLGYPSIAYLMHIKKIQYNENFTNPLKGIKWKDINQKFKNDFLKTEKHVRNSILLQGINLKEFDNEIKNIMNQIKKLDLNLLGQKTKPPKGY
jgi:hypothetical protein